MKVFVIHAKRTGYGVVRCLKDHSKDIYVADTNETAVFYSKHIKKGFVISEITETQEDIFLREMIDLAHEMDYMDEKPVVFTGRDDYLLFFSKNYDRLKEYYKLSFESDYSILEKALSKTDLVELAKESGVRIPLSFKNGETPSEMIKQAEFPMIIKPAIKNSPEVDVVKEAFRLKLCDDINDLNEGVLQLQKLNVDYVVQEYIPGDDSHLYTFGSYAKDGEIKAWATSQKLRQFPPDTGQCSFGKTIMVKELFEPSKKLLAHLGFTGVSQIEYKEYNGNYYLIEINPRIWAWHHIHLAVGVNLSLVAMDHETGNIYDTPVQPLDKTKYWMFFMMDLLHNNLLVKKASIFTIVRDLLRTDIEAFFSWKDLKVSFIHTKRTIGYMRKVIKESKSDR